MSDYSSAVQTLGEWEQSIGAAIRRLRIDAGLDQEALADRANVSRSSVQALEGGKGTRLRTLLAVLRALGRNDLFESIMPLTQPSPMQALALSRRAAKTPQRYRETGGRS
ncbi:MAG: helix-turn-helix domain-containing protein [Actinomycetales bacterium]|nr:helix-turn-helix domain-containing protein [Actinomycetales bacterium]